MSLIGTWDLTKEAFRQWLAHDPFTQGAALAYYALFSLAPILVIAVGIAGLVFGEEAAQGRVATELSQQTSPEVAQTTEKLLQTTYTTGHGPVATTVGLVVLLIGASGLFAQLQYALNIVWDVQAKGGSGLLGMLKYRLWSFLAVLGVGLLLIASLVGSTMLTTVSSFVGPAALPGGISVWRLVDWLVSLGLLTLLFAMIYRVLPDADIDWKDVWVGSILTAFLFTLGKFLIGLYLGWSAITSPFGAAGSLVLILLWVYYSSLIILFGAELTHVYANRT